MMGIIIHKLPSSNWIILEFGGSKLLSICLLLFSDVNEIVTLYICGEEILTDLTIQKLDSYNFSVILCEFCISIGWTWFYWNQSQTYDKGQSVKLDSQFWGTYLSLIITFLRF